MNWAELALIVSGVIALSVVALLLRPTPMSIYVEDE